MAWKRDGCDIVVKQDIDTQSCDIGAIGKNKDFGSVSRPESVVVNINVECEKTVNFAIKIRLPQWLKGEAAVIINGEAQKILPVHLWESTFIQLMKKLPMFTCISEERSKLMLAEIR